jgi:tetratricopeptide (TPR) repeat protein
MKRLMLAVLGVGTLVGLAFYVNRSKAPSVSPPEPGVASTPDQMVEERQPAKTHAVTELRPSRSSENAGSLPQTSLESASSPQRNIPASIALNQAVDILVHRQATFEQKQAAWKQLRETGKLDQAINDLEQRAANDPRTADYPAALGQAYLQKCATIQDVREQGILAMQADKVFDAALNLDLSNWEARFTKAVALSYWPANLNKGQEVIEHFQTLIQQQEAQTAQPQFAETYLWLGDQYQKAGRTDEARAVWQQGAALFSDHQALKSRLTPAQ